MSPKRKKPGRNDPCACGSGRKSKRCCGPASGDAASLHVLDEECVTALLGFARDTDEEQLKELFEEVPGHHDESYLQLNVPLIVYHGEIDGVRILERYLDAHGERLSGRKRQWLEGQRRAWLSIWEVQGVKRGMGMELRDRLTGETRYVHERSASESVSVRSSVLARVVDCEGVSVLCGMHPIALPPMEAQAVLEECREVMELDPDAPVAPAELSGWVALDLLDCWEETTGEFLERPLPALQNTDGDPLLPTRDSFAIKASKRAALAGVLAQLSGFEGDEAGWRFTVTRSGNEQNPSWENTVIGSVELKEAELVAETNSLARADALRAQLESAAGDLITFRERESTDLAELLASAPPPGGGAENAGGDLPPEVVAQLEQEYKAQHYATWPDIALPALGGLTPREAAQRGGEAREQLEALLRDMEYREGKLPRGRRYPFGELRAELGMLEVRDSAS